MKRNMITMLAICYALSTSGLALYVYGKGIDSVSSNKKQVTISKKSSDNEGNAYKETFGLDIHKETKSLEDNSTIKTLKVDKKAQTPLNRGGAPIGKTQNDIQAKQQLEKVTKVELLDWWKEAKFVFSNEKEAEVKDVYTGKTFKIKRVMGTNHADCETLTAADTAIMKEIWGGFSWTRRPVHIIVDGRVLAASMAGMPHAGIDAAPAYATVSNRAGGFGRGQNLDTIKGNGMDGHFDVHFLNSKTHGTSRIDPEHQAAVKKAAGK